VKSVTQISSGQVGAQAGVVGLQFSGAAGRGGRLGVAAVFLHPVAQRPGVDAQFLGGAGDVPAMTLAVFYGGLLEGGVIAPPGRTRLRLGWFADGLVFVHGFCAAHITQSCPPNRYRLRGAAPKPPKFIALEPWLRGGSAGTKKRLQET
jgi:hypothetical protein